MALSDLNPLAHELLLEARAKKLLLATAESCTGGLVAAALTNISGSSDVFDSAFVTYSYAAKERLLGIPHSMLMKEGAVCEEVARAMAEAALERTHADVTVAVTGIAGPTGETPGKPVGLVHFAAARKGETIHEAHEFGGLDREGVREKSVEAALKLMLTLVHAV